MRAKVPPARLQEILAELVGRQVVFSLGSGLFIHRDTAAETERRALDIVGEFHRQSPESPGLPAEQLRQLMPVEKAVLDGLIARLKSDGRLVEKNQRLALPEHRSTFRDEEGRLLEALDALFRDKIFSPPSIEEAAQQTGVAVDKATKAIDILRQHERLVQVEPGMVFHREAVDRARELLFAHFRKEGRLESVQFKYLLDTTRKFALPLLDYLDRTGVTRRVGNTRFPRELPPS